MTVIKRTGKIEKLSKKKIFDSISNANLSVSEEERLTQYQLNRITDSIYSFCDSQEEPISIDVLENIIEKKIMEHGAYEVAKRYITYRYEKERARENKAITEKLMAKNVQNQNANVDEKSFGGRVGETASYVMKEYALNNLISKKGRMNHLNNEIYIHDLDSYAVGSHNCLSIPFDKLLANGFTTRQTDVRPASSINTAFQLVAVIFQLQSLQQFGGVAATHLDWTMVPYVRLSFHKHYLDGLHYICKKDLCCDSDKEYIKTISIQNYDRYRESAAYEYALEQTQKELDQAVEGMYHNLNTLQSRSGNQLPFTSINYGTCTLTEGRMVIESLLDGCLNGVGKYHQTAIFPCGIFQSAEGINRKEGDPNYDLFQKALKSTAKRIYPNYANVNWSGNAGYDPENPSTYFSTMGALAGHEHLYVKIGDNVYDMPIKDFYEYCKNTQSLDQYRQAQIFFSKEPMEKQPGNKHIQTKSGLENKAGVYCITYVPQDVSYVGSASSITRRLAEHKSHIKRFGALDSGCVFGDTNTDNYKFEVLEYTDNYKEMEEKYILKIPNINFRGIDKKYYKNNTGTKILKERPLFRTDLTKKQDLIDITDKDIKVLDRDNKWVAVKHVFKNDKLNTPYMMHVYYKEFDKTYCLTCTEDHPLWTGKEFVRADHLNVGDHLYRADNVELTIIDIGWHWCQVDSYDIGTVTGSFIGSDIIMHNCRTANGYDINCDDPKLGQLKDGRGNISPVTIILPTLAMEAKEKIEKLHENEKAVSENEVIEAFMKILDKKINEAKDMLLERFDWQCSQSPKSASFMYENNTMYGYKPEEGIRSALKHGTLAIGQLGLAETLQILICRDHTTEKGMDLAKKIEQLFKDKCSKFKNELKMNFGVYYTPAENLCFTALRKFKEKYGVIKNVSDKDFFTNSMHVPVWNKIDAFKKIDVESQLTPYSSAGCITYCELDADVSKNVKAMEDLVLYAMEHDIPYFAINIPINTCQKCGYSDPKMEDKCPKCGAGQEDIMQLRRVTGYLSTTLKHFNLGKQNEVENRVKHTGVEITE